MHAWRPATRKTYYRCYILQWIQFCQFHGYDPYHASVVNVTMFLRLMLQDGASYKTTNVARCALSSVLDTGTRETIGCDTFVKWVLKGCGNLVPLEPKYDSTWDVSTVFRVLIRWGRNADLSLLKLSQKLTILLLLCTAQRGQTVWLFRISGLKWTDYGVRFNMKDQLKHNKPSDPLSTIKVYSYPRNKLLCPVTCLKCYVKRTKEIRSGIDQLLVTTTKPYRPVARNMVSSWVKQVLKYA